MSFTRAFKYQFKVPNFKSTTPQPAVPKPSTPQPAVPKTPSKSSTPQSESGGVEEKKESEGNRKALEFLTKLTDQNAERMKEPEKKTTQPPPKEFKKPKARSPMKARDEDSDDETVNNDKYNPMNEKLNPIFKEAHNLLSSSSIVQLPDKYNVSENNPSLYTSLNQLIDKIHNKKQGTSDYRTLKTIRRELHFNPNGKAITTPKKK